MKKKALIIDWLDKYGGAERVIAAMQKIFGFDVTYTLANVMHPDDLSKIYTTGEQNISLTPLKRTNRHFRLFFFLFHYFISKIKIDPNVDLIISSSHSVAKGVTKSNARQLHISYFQARNFNYIWHDVSLYFGKCASLVYPLIYILRKIDIRQSRYPDFIISNSQFVKEWVKKVYNRDSHVIYPPIDLEKFELNQEREDYYVAVGRLASVKRFDVAINAFNKNGKKLFIIGDGERANHLRSISKSNITFLGFLESDQVATYISKSRALIQIGVEGFGIAPIEAQACGTPVIAFRDGGVVETVIENKTGIFFDKQTPESLQDAIDRFESISLDPTEIRTQALRFSSERFERELKIFVDQKWNEHQKKFAQGDPL